MALAAFAAARTRDDYPPEDATVHFGPYQAAGIAGNTNYPLFVTDRPMDIEQITMRARTVGVNGTIAFGYAPSGTAMSSGILFTAAEAISQLTGATAFTIALTNDALEIPAGSVIFFRTASTPSDIADLVITVRKRTARYRTTDNGSRAQIITP